MRAINTSKTNPNGNPSTKIALNRRQRLYILPVNGGGYTCLGFDVCEERIRGLAKEMDVQPQSHSVGTHGAYRIARLILL